MQLLQWRWNHFDVRLSLNRFTQTRQSFTSPPGLNQIVFPIGSSCRLMFVWNFGIRRALRLVIPQPSK